MVNQCHYQNTKSRRNYILCFGNDECIIGSFCILRVHKLTKGADSIMLKNFFIYVLSFSFQRKAVHTHNDHWKAMPTSHVKSLRLMFCRPRYTVCWPTGQILSLRNNLNSEAQRKYHFSSNLSISLKLVSYKEFQINHLSQL